jgi:hypothetical protein
MRWDSATATARTGYEQALNFIMIRWIIVIFLALMLINWFSPFLQRMGFGKLPGDFRFKLFGRDWFIPLATTVILSLVAGFISKLV